MKRSDSDEVVFAQGLTVTISGVILALGASAPLTLIVAGIVLMLLVVVKV